ncbi:MAG: transporter, partial [Betaproteobacteria bacterium]
VYKVVDGSGKDITLAPIAPITLNATPLIQVKFPVGSVAFNQTQGQLNLLGGYLTQDTYADGRIAFALNLPLIQQHRSFVPSQPAGTLSPALASLPLSPFQNAVLNNGLATANNTVQSRVAVAALSQNVDVTGIGDTELSVLWVRHKDRLKIAAGASLFVPTGAFDKTRGPNPGFGNFYTLRPGVALTYALSPEHTDTAAWDTGVTLAARLSYGMNSTNKDTNYRSGNFVYAELGAVKVFGNWAAGANVLSTQQVSDDSGTLAPAGGNRYQTYGFGPFLSYKLPGKEAGFNLQYSDNFEARNALVVRSLQLRFVKAW